MSAHTQKRGPKPAAKPNPPLRYAGEDSRRFTSTKRGPGRKHNQGKGHKYVPREVERSEVRLPAVPA
jgi:hypothetical protein